MPFKTAICPECVGTGTLSASEVCDSDGRRRVVFGRACPYCTHGQIQVYVPEQPEPRQPDMTWHELSVAMVGYGIVAGLFIAVIYGERIAAWWHGVIQ
jgi:hypothetical protein